ncbi:transposase [Maioricimonas rarisocia]|uniref:transposase n=1 Tax=Maioricimonas rarisocia TaxID=2528026 RepID=UPI001E2A89BA|nr:transposase [Maioricimonas rarisocia]
MSDNRRIADDHLYCHFVTFSCDRRRRLLDENQPKRILLGQLNAQRKRQSAKCVGFVVMPDHVHAIVWFPQIEQLSRFMHGWKRRSSFAIRDGTTAKTRTTFRLPIGEIALGHPGTTRSRSIPRESWKRNSHTCT